MCFSISSSSKLPKYWGMALLGIESLGLGLVLWVVSAFFAPGPVAKAAPEAITCNAGTLSACVVVSGTLTNQTWYSDTMYVITGTYVPTNVVITIQPSTTIKIFADYPLPVTGTRASLIVSGMLDIQSNGTNPVVFTSYRDDTRGGDTNGDGGITQAAPGDYLEIRWANNNNAFSNAVVRYGYYGVRVLNTLTTPITPTIAKCHL